MLDENLPAFFLKPSLAGIKHHASIHLSHRGSEPEPVYSLQYLDPASPSQAHKNCYAAALFDAFIPDVLFGEVLARPTWTQPSLSAEEIRRHGGIPPPPEPRVPSEFSIQLYNPDQQITVKLKEGKWGSSDTYDFSLPERTFRAPSASTLDRGQSDPGTLDITPRINFIWKREHKLSKDLSCFMTGKSTDTEKKKSRRDPDINVALWRNMRELTLYESNLSRIDTEDPKGLEVTLLLSAIVIKDLYFASKDRVPELFNIQQLGAPRRTSNPTANAQRPIPGGPPPLPARKSSKEPPSGSSPAAQQPYSRPPPPDPREQWQIEAETARLRAVAEAEAREVARQKREKEKAEEAEYKRLQRIVKQEQDDARRRDEEVQRETERLRRIYGLEGQSLQPPGTPSRQREEPPRRSFQGDLSSVPQGQPASFASSSSHPVMSGANGNPSMLSVASIPGQPKKKKSSFFGIRSASDELSPTDGRNRLSKKQSAMW